MGCRESTCSGHFAGNSAGPAAFQRMKLAAVGEGVQPQRLCHRIRISSAELKECANRNRMTPRCQQSSWNPVSCGFQPENGIAVRTFSKQLTVEIDTRLAVNNPQIQDIFLRFWQAWNLKFAAIPDNAIIGRGNVPCFEERFFARSPSGRIHCFRLPVRVDAVGVFFRIGKNRSILLVPLVHARGIFLTGGIAVCEQFVAALTHVCKSGRLLNAFLTYESLRGCATPGTVDDSYRRGKRLVNFLCEIIADAGEHSGALGCNRLPGISASLQRNATHP